MKTDKNAPDAPLPGSGGSVRVIRCVLGSMGVGLIAYGVLGLPTKLGPSELFGLLVWMAVAVLLHDGVIVPVSTLAGFTVNRLGSRLRPASSAVLRGTLMTGAIVSVIAGLLIKAQSTARSTSALEADYATNLLWFQAALITVATIVIYSVERRSRRGESR